MATIAGVAPGPPAGYVQPGHPHYQHRQVPRLGPWNDNRNHDEPERWICIYPAYLNSKKSLKDGRRIPKEKAVDTPTYEEIKMVLDESKFEYILERKFYPRERSKEPPYIGRFKVHLKDKEGEFIKPEFETRDSIMLHVAEKIPTLKIRTQPKVPAAVEAQQQAAQTSGSAGAKKKKGKK